jgi:hypothetical protein
MSYFGNPRVSLSMTWNSVVGFDAPAHLFYFLRCVRLSNFDQTSIHASG